MMPEFIIIGAQRCGTTWLQENLSLHPEIFMPTPKELHFFDRDKNYERGLIYYQSKFPKNTDKICGEATPNYFYSKSALPRIAINYPNIKHILILRNPVDRLYSHFQLNNGNKKKMNQESFEEYFSRHPRHIEQGKYINHLKNYLQYFRYDQILILFFSEIITNPKNIYAQVLSFLNCDNLSFCPKNLEIKRNSGGIKKYHCKNLFLYYTMLALKKFKFYNCSIYIEEINNEEKKDHLMTLDMKKRIIDIYRESNQELSDYLQVNLADWNKI